MYLKNVTIAVLALLISASFTQAATYNIDPSHTEVSFKVKHLGLANVGGKFLDFSGVVEFDPENIQASKTKATIKVASIDTANQKRDDHLRSEDFFNAKKNPLITFESTEIKDVQGSNFTVVGNLSINGIEKPVSLQMEHTGSAIDPWGNQRVGFQATTKINRKEFGLSWNKLLETGGLVVGEEVQVLIELEAIKDKK